MASPCMTPGIDRVAVCVWSVQIPANRRACFRGNRADGQVYASLLLFACQCWGGWVEVEVGGGVIVNKKRRGPPSLHPSFIHSFRNVKEEEGWTEGKMAFCKHSGAVLFDPTTTSNEND